MRKTAREISQANGEQARAAREIVKAAKSTTAVATQLRKASSEQATAAKQIATAIDSMRRGAANTSRALEEQATAGEQVSKETERLSLQIAGVTKAIGEQARAASEISSATNSMRQQSLQVAKAMEEQTRAVTDMTTATRSVSKEIAAIALSNREHLSGALRIQETLTRVRAITERNASGVTTTLSSSDGLLQSVQQVKQIITELSPANKSKEAKTRNSQRTNGRGRERNTPALEPPGEDAAVGSPAGGGDE
jgi:methyl-accepting chemotaxis protein